MGKKKKLKKAYRKGRKEGFDHGFNTAKMIFTEIAVEQEKKLMELRVQIEELNNEIILGEEEEEDE